MGERAPPTLPPVLWPQTMLEHTRKGAAGCFGRAVDAAEQIAEMAACSARSGIKERRGPRFGHAPEHVLHERIVRRLTVIAAVIADQNWLDDHLAVGDLLFDPFAEQVEQFLVERR